MVRIFHVAFAMTLFFFLPVQLVWAQPAASEDFVTYEKQSGFVKEFAVPFEELGLRGIAADSQGKVWFYHSTNTTSTLVSFNLTTKEFTKFPVEGETVADEPIINLASSQLVFDGNRNAVWFTDARTNSVGKLDVASGQIDSVKIPTENAGPMGIALSPDSNSVWFTEITGDKIAIMVLSSSSPIYAQSPTALTLDS